MFEAPGTDGMAFVLKVTVNYVEFSQSLLHLRRLSSAKSLDILVVMQLYESIHILVQPNEIDSFLLPFRKARGNKLFMKL